MILVLPPSRFLLIGCLLVAGASRATSSSQLPGWQPDGSVLLPNQWSLKPAGRQVPIGDFPLNLALHRDGRHAAVLHCGWGQHEVRIVEVKTGRAVSQAALDEAFYGLAWSGDGATLFVSGAGTEVVHAFTFTDGYLSARRELRTRPVKERGVPAGIAVSGDGTALFVCEVWGQRVSRLAVAGGAPVWSRSLGPRPSTRRMSHEENRVETEASAAAPFPYACVLDEERGRLYVSLWAQSAVLVLDASTGTEIARWPVGPHPNEMTLARDGRLFVAEANHNSVSVIDVAAGRVLERLSASLYPDAPPGSMPNALALSPDGELLFVANATNNNVAVFDVEKRGQSRSLGFIPVGWFPTSVRVSSDGRTLLVANGKGAASAPNPRGPYPGSPAPRNLEEYIGGLFKGTLSIIDLPEEKDREARFGAWARTAKACSPLPESGRPRGERPAGSPIPAKVGDPSPIRNVIYVVRENRTYDQVLGDLEKGRGDPRLCLFGEKITPNAHALARDFVLFDNLYADGEVSADGHEWTMGAYATDFVEKSWPLSYGHNALRKYDYPSEGAYQIATPAGGYLWDRAAAAGVSYRSYGEFCFTPTKPGPVQSIASLPSLVGHIDEQYRAWDMDYPDVKRAERFISELRRFERDGGMPRLQVLRLGNDHTQGTRAGKVTPAAMVAENDLALGLIVEAVSRSRFWNDTAIFVLEDDTQNGADHIDAHRMPGFVLGAWVKRGVVDSTMYSTSSMLRTIELILGLQPMSQYDAAAMPMWNAFSDRPDPAPYIARPAQIDLNARNAALAWGGAESERMDFSAPDRADDIRLNEIVWRSVRGADSPMPAPIRAAFFKAHRDDE